MTRSIQSPGVEIIEKDISLTANLNFGATTFFATGFADKGPLDEAIYVSSYSEFQDIFGEPTNAAERYFHHAVKPILTNTTNVIVSRLPYGSENGDVFGTKYTALYYPVKTLSQEPDRGTTTLSA
jgi:hypothetical protein